MKAQRGISMVQLAIVIAVGGLFAVAAIAYGIRYVERTKVANELLAIAELRSKTVSYGARVGPFKTATNASLAAVVGQDFFPAQMVSGTAAAPIVTNQWGGLVGVSVGNLINPGDALMFTYVGVPQYACTELGTSLDSIARQVLINGQLTKAYMGVTDPVAVASACASATTAAFIFELPR